MTLQSLSRRSHAKSGFTLVELAIVLAVAAVLLAGLWRLVSGGGQQVRDQAAADHMRQVIEGTKGYFASDAGQTALKAATVGTPYNIDMNLVLPYLPAGFNNVNSYGQAYNIRYYVTDDSPLSYKVMMLTAGGEDIPDTSGGRIAGLIGSEGGFIYSTNVCNATFDDWACGAYGGWQTNVTTNPNGFGFTAGTRRGHVAAQINVVAGTDTSVWLARKKYTPESDYNTMQTNLYLDDLDLPPPDPTNSADYAAPSPSDHDLFLQNNRIVGGNRFNASLGQPSGGMISRLAYLRISQPRFGGGGSGGADNHTSDFALKINGCNKYAVDNTLLEGCESNGAQFNTDVVINGSLTAWNVDGNSFVYKGSDIRLKHDIRPIEHALDDLSKIRALSFVMNNGNEKSMGVLAQEVEKVYPQLIHNTPDGYKGVDYMGLIGPLLGAIHELKAQNESLTEQLRDQAQAIEALQKKNLSEE